jgi:YfiH family protein
MTIARIVPDWPAPAHVGALVTGRGGGVSVGRYAGLNLAAHVGDAPQAVRENRRRLVQDLELPSEPVWLDQVHGARIVDLDSAPSGPADGAVTSRRGVVCAILSADCLPVLLTDRAGTRIGAAHAGWRGLAAGVLAAAVGAMGLPSRDLLAWLGPAIGPNAYEVGDEVRAAFLARDPAARAAFAANARGRWQADLYSLARLSLAAAGVAAIYGGGSCTATEAERFFSHRREAPCGRMATLIWLAPR